MPWRPFDPTYTRRVRYRPSISRATAIDRVTAICGAANVKLLDLPNGTDTTTSVESSAAGHTITWDADVSGRFSRLGNGFVQSFNGVDQYGTVTDDDAFSFGNGAADSPFSVFAFANVTASGAARCLLGKWAAGGFEWSFELSAAGLLVLTVRDVSASNAQCFRASSGAVPTGQPVFLAGTYDGRGSGAATGMALYVNALPFASTATNDSGGTYVAMENGTEEVGVGVRGAHTAAFMNGQVGALGLVAGAASGSNVAAFAQVMRDLYGVPL